MKLPKPRKRGSSYRIEIMIDGERLSATRDTARECEQWASEQILKSKAGHKLKSERKTSITLQELMTLRYEAERVGKKGESYDRDMMRVLPRDHAWLTSMMVVDIKASDLTRYRDIRIKQVKPATVKREFGYLSAVFNYAVTDLFILDKNPCNDVNKPSDSKPRYRRISNDEIQLILDACDYKIGDEPTDIKHYAAWIFVWAVQSAMRRNEIMSMDWSHVHKNHVHLPTSKTDSARDVPLSPIMRQLLDSLPSKKGKLIPVKVDSIDTAWGRALKKTGIKDLQFRDSRHEAISRMVNTKKIPVEQLAKITGHKKIETLVNVYYNPTADDLYQALYGD